MNQKKVPAKNPLASTVPHVLRHNNFAPGLKSQDEMADPLPNFAEVLPGLADQWQVVAMEVALPTEYWLMLMEICQGDISKVPGVLTEVIVDGRSLPHWWLTRMPDLRRKLYTEPDLESKELARIKAEHNLARTLRGGGQ